jgi:hypothetical protein
METTQRFSLPLLSAGQAQKELFHNESLLIVDALLCAAVEEPQRNDPPATPVAGSCYIVGNSPTGAWSSNPGHLAIYSDAGWRFVKPVDGLTVVEKSSGTAIVHRGGAWESGIVRASSVVVDDVQIIGAQESAIADPAGGAFIDSESRFAISAILSALRTHGLIAS